MKRPIEATQFSMAHQDARYYLNGMLFENGRQRTAQDRRPPSGGAHALEASLPSHSVISAACAIELMRMLDGAKTSAARRRQ